MVRTTFSGREIIGVLTDFATSPNSGRGATSASDIETQPLGVAHDAVNGTFVCGDDCAFERFKTAIEAAFDDQRDTLRSQQRDVIDRIAAEGLRG